jgi:hypothetical protein
VRRTAENAGVSNDRHFIIRAVSVTKENNVTVQTPTVHEPHTIIIHAFPHTQGRIKVFVTLCTLIIVATPIDKYLHYVQCFVTVRSQVLTATNMKVTDFWDVVPCSLVKVDRHFRNACCLNQQALIFYT